MIFCQFPPALWLLLFVMMLFDFVWTPFTHRLVNILTELFGGSTQASAWKASVNYAIAMVLNPVAGFFFDFVGYRPHAYVFGAVSLMVSMSLITYSSLNPMYCLVLYSLSYSLNPIAAISMLPFLYDVRMIATVLGISKCVGNIGATFMDPIFGQIYELEGKSYLPVLHTLFIFSCIIAMLSIFFLLVTQHKFRFLNYNCMSLQQVSEEVFKSAQRPNKTISKIAIVFFLLMLVGSWASFIYNAVKTYH